MHLQESGEMYLEAILVLSQRGRPVRSIDVCEYLGYTKPSASRAMSLLRNGGYVTADRNNYLRLTEAGQNVAERIYERHRVLTQLFTMLGVSREAAVKDACRIEHVISDETFNAIKQQAELFSGM
ncbi:MAG: metal-dependent transcriptional regulator [Oscillospiraceae bacterium]|nr:metal-dependent transcriptional regulator [Oscillospiraceae bacterium]